MGNVLVDDSVQYGCMGNVGMCIFEPGDPECEGDDGRMKCNEGCDAKIKQLKKQKTEDVKQRGE